MAGGTGAALAIGTLCIGVLLRAVWHLPIPLTVFGAGLVLLAGDVWLSRMPAQAAPADLDRFNFFHCLLDSLIVTFVVQQLGVNWIGAFFYLFVILNANISLRRAHSSIVTAVCVIAFVFSMLIAYHGLVPGSLFPQRELSADPAYVTSVILVVSISGMVLFSLTFGAFAATLRARTDELDEANLQLEQAAERLRSHRDELEREVERRTSDLRTALSHLRSTHEELRRLDELKTTFLANVSHELRTPLTSIRSFAEILLQFPDEGSANREEFLEIIAAEADRLARLIDDVLDLSKIESGHMDWHFSAVDLTSLLSFCVRTMAPLAAAKALDLRLELPADLPRARADRDRVAQVLNNLVGNALKFTERGEVAVGAAASNDEIVIRVADTGPGIPETERQHVFEKFHQVDEGLTTKPRGTGLGLAICAEIVASHGGRIWVDSTPGVGSAFHFTLPVEAQDAGAPPAPRAARQKLVLIGDSDQSARALHRAALEHAGYAVREATNGREVLRLAACCAPDLVCVDVLPPDMSGLAVLRALRSSNDTRRIPVIMVSVMEDKEWALQLGAARHLVKSVSGAELVAAVEETLAAGPGSQTPREAGGDAAADVPSPPAADLDARGS
jgi:signal transduction histidine kinase/CheY-like chemotaxis protein